MPNPFIPLPASPSRPVPSPPVQFDKVAIVGMGLLGGSLGRALRDLHLARCVAGFARRPETLAECHQVGATDLATLRLDEAVHDADLVVLCTPVGQMGSIAAQARPHLRPDALVTDVGSVKAAVVRDVENALHGSGIAFVGAHPMAGSEKTGVLASRPDLYRNARCVITPSPSVPAPAVDRVEAFWNALGTRTVRMSPAEHDACVARSSHLPQVLASVLAHHVLDPAHPPGVSDLCATGFKDTSRLASGSPEMWRDIALANRTEIRNALDGYARELALFQAALESGDADTLSRFLSQARDRRDAWLARFRGACTDPAA